METSLDPFRPDQQVRVMDNPGRGDSTTGKIRSMDSLAMVQVAMGPNDKEYIPVESLELIPAEEDRSSLFAKGSFGAPRDLRRIVTLTKVQGDLSNVFYSMESSNTDFYANQFKPVLPFIESVTGRFLIADEFGLGKPIESMYVWQKFRAREDARFPISAGKE